jgi:hypothetical protein
MAKFSDPRDKEIVEAHRRFIKVMEEERLIQLSGETKATYLKLLTTAADKLEIPGKPISEVVREMMTELGPLIFQAMQS